MTDSLRDSGRSHGPEFGGGRRTFLIGFRGLPLCGRDLIGIHFRHFSEEKTGEVRFDRHTNIW